MVDIKWPPAILPLAGSEVVPVLQGGKIVGTTASAFTPSLPPVTGGGVAVGDYATIRASNFPNTTNTVTLTDPFKGGTFVRSPTPLRDNGGTVINDSVGTSWVRVYTGRVSAAWFYNAPGGGTIGDGTIRSVTAADQTANPQWIGLTNGMGAMISPTYPVNTYWDFVALQEWVYCMAADRSVPGTVTWNNSPSAQPYLNRPGFCPRGQIHMNQMLVIIGAGLDIEFASKLGSILYWHGTGGLTPYPMTAVATANVGPAILFNAISYSTIRNLYVNDQIGVNNYLVQIDWYHAVTSSLKTQQVLFDQWFVAGNIGLSVATPVAYTPSMSQVGIAIAPQGAGSGQGDTILFNKLTLVGPFIDGVAIDGQNAVRVMFIDGDLQYCNRRGISAVGGDYCAINQFTEMIGNIGTSYPQQHHLTLDGCDFYASQGYGPSMGTTVIGSRSESIISCIDTGIHLGMANVSITTINQMTQGWTANTGYQLGTAMYIPGNGYTAVMCVDDGMPPWFQSDTSSTTTTIVYPGTSPGWTTNQFVGKKMYLRFYNGTFVSVRNIIANTANTITVDSAFSLAGSSMVKIGGVSGSTAPVWANFPQSYTNCGRVVRNATGWGWTTTAGSNVATGLISSGGGGIVAGDYAVVCNAKRISSVYSVPPNTYQGPLLNAALIAKVATQSGVGGGTFTFTDSLGNPVNADVNMTDAFGYWGVPIADGDLTWIIIDFDVIMGVRHATNLSLGGGGRAQACDQIQLYNFPYPFTNVGRLSNFNSGWSGAAPGSYAIQTAPPCYTLNNQATTITTSPLTVPIAWGYLGLSEVITYYISVNPLTFNMPVFSPTITDSVTFILMMRVANGTLTWGANIRATNPGLTAPATSDKRFIVTMKWVSDTGGAGTGVWYVTNVEGPM